MARKGSPGAKGTMRTSSVGKRNRDVAGVTLIEMLVVLTLISFVVGISYVAVTAGIETLRLNSATQSIVSFINSGLSYAERRQQVVQVTIAKAENALYLRSSRSDLDRRLAMPDGVTIESVLPEMQGEDPESARYILLYPGGTVPAFGVVVINRKRAERVVRVDPITGVPQIENPANQRAQDARGPS